MIEVLFSFETCTELYSGIPTALFVSVVYVVVPDEDSCINVCCIALLRYYQIFD